MGSAASSSIADGELILNQLHWSQSLAVFKGALRLHKLWAYRRQIYGANLGLLGGGGWALLISRAMSKGLSDGNFQLAAGGENDLDINSIRVLSYFFHEMEQCWNQGIFAHNGTQICEEIKEQTLGRGTVAVLAPASGGDFARNTTRSTASAMIKEIQRANAILRSCADDEEAEFLSEGSSFLFLQIDVGRLAKLEGGPSLPEARPGQHDRSCKQWLLWKVRWGMQT